MVSYRNVENEIGHERRARFVCRLELRFVKNCIHSTRFAMYKIVKSERKNNQSKYMITFLTISVQILIIFQYFLTYLLVYRSEAMVILF